MGWERMREGRGTETQEEEGDEANRETKRREEEGDTVIPGLGVNEGRESKDKGRERRKDGTPSP